MDDMDTTESTENGTYGDGDGTTSSYYCDVCEATVEGQPDEHAKTRIHCHRIRYKERAKQLEQLEATFEAKGLEVITQVETEEPKDKQQMEIAEWISVARQPLIGMEYAYEIIQHDPKKLRYYACRLCAAADIHVIKHMVSISHRVNYLVRHYDDVKPFIDKIYNSNEKTLVNELIETKGFPIHRPQWAGTAINKVLAELCVKITSRQPRKRFQVHVERCESSVERHRQPCVSSQLRGVPGTPQIMDYPMDLLKKVWQHGINFALHKEAPKNLCPEDKKIQAALGLATEVRSLLDPLPYPSGPMGGPPMGGPMRGPPMGGPMRGPPMGGPMRGPPMGGPMRGPPMGGPMRGPPMGGPMPRLSQSFPGMGDPMPLLSGSMTSGNTKITLLSWMQQTARKLDMEDIGAKEYELLETMLELLKCGVSMFHTNPKAKDICYYPNQDLIPEGIYLKQWLELSVEYFGVAWLCSKREVEMAKTLISQIEQKRRRYLEFKSTQPMTMGMAVATTHPESDDPYDALESQSYSTGGDFMGYQQGYQDGHFELYQNPKQWHGRHSGKPYQRNNRSGNMGRY